MRAPTEMATRRVVIEPMRRRHLRQVLRIERQVHPRPWSRSLYEAELDQPGTRCYLVARAVRTVVGYGGLMFVAGEAHVTTLAVDPPWQGRRLGRRLLLGLAREAVARGAASLTLEVAEDNRHARSLYEAFGLRDAGRRVGYYPEVGQDAIVMWATDIQSPGYASLLDERAKEVTAP